MANTPNSRKVALETAKDRREQLVDEQALKEIELSNAQTARERKQIQKELNALIKEEASIRARIASYEDKSVAAEKSIADSLQDQISTLKIKKNLSDKLSKSEDLQLRATKIIQSQLERGVITYEQAEDAVKKLNRSIRERLSIEEKTKKVLDASKESANAFLNDVSKGIGKLPVIGDSLSSGFNKFINSDAGKKVRDKLAEKMFDSKVIGKSLKGALGLGLVGAGIGIAGAGIKMTLATEQAMKDQQRSIGLANEQSNTADEMQRGLLLSTKSMVTNLEEARKATAELIDNFGTFATENSTLVDQQVNLTKAYGLQAEEASDFQRSAMISGQSTEEMKIAVLSTAAGFNKTTKSTQSLSGVLRMVSKLSDSIRIQFRGSGQELTNAVMKAKMLGTTLEDLNGVADQLLNIESSIENQVTAQLVTGRNINLDRARFFALTDDMNGLMDELVKQEIDYASYSKMNRVEKQATAAALGMSTDQMAKFVSQQELATKLGLDMAAAENQTSEGLERSLKSNQERIAQMAALGNEAAKQYERDNEALTTQEKMNKLVDMMISGFKFLGPILIGIGAAIIIIGIGLLKAAIAAAGLTAALSGGLAGFAIAAGVAVAAGAIVGAVQMVSDGIAPSSNGPFTITDKYGATAVTANGDGLAVSPNINTGSSNKETNDLLRQLIAKVDQPAIIKMGDTTINELGNKTTLNRNYQAEA
jgi:hypothetical protein